MHVEERELSAVNHLLVDIALVGGFSISIRHPASAGRTRETKILEKQTTSAALLQRSSATLPLLGIERERVDTEHVAASEREPISKRNCAPMCSKRVQCAAELSDAECREKARRSSADRS